MSTPRWLREQRRWTKARPNIRRRLFLPPPPPDLSPDFTAAFGRLWAIPEEDA